MTTPRLSIQRVPDLTLPAYQTPGAAGLDLVAREFARKGEPRATSCELGPGQRILAMTGLFLAIPEGHVGMVCPRSGLALEHGISVLNAPGIIDADFRGEVGVLLVNLGAETVRLERGMRVAQMVVTPFARVEIAETTELPATDRGAGGFGSTGR